jgi:enoyl-CoA hydratase/carnithine racemase
MIIYIYILIYPYIITIIACIPGEDSFVKLLDRIRNLPVPVPGSIAGTGWGGATDICACCDVLIATPQTTFAITPAKIGLPYNHSGMSHFIQANKWRFLGDVERFMFL